MKQSELFSSQIMVPVLHLLYLLYLLESPRSVVGLHDTLFRGDSLSPNQSLVSESGVFQLGFINETNTESLNATSVVQKKNYYLAISFRKSPNAVIWKANSDKPISDPESSALELTPSGDLNLTQFNSSIWAFQSSDEILNKPVSTVLVLHDNGNLVLQDRENSLRVIWQSFDDPTDTWLAGAPLGFNTVTGNSTSLISQHDYSLEIDSSRTRGFIIKIAFGISDYYGSFPRWLDIQQIDGNGLVKFHDTREPYLFIKLSFSQVSILQWVDNSDTLKTLWYAPGSMYNFNSLCKGYSSCPPARDLCSGPNALQPTSPNDDGDRSNIAGCPSNIYLNCQTTHNSHYFNTFNLIRNVDKYPDDPQSLVVQSENECEAACFSNCSCSAYAYQLYNNDCNLWFGELLNGIVQDYVGNKPIKVRFHSPKGSKPLWIFILVIGFVVSAGVGLLFCWRHKVPFLAKQPKVEQFLVVYSYRHIKAFTRNFSNKVGEGGFGSVFKGWLTSSTMVAIKRLKSNSSDEKQFRAEVRTIGRIHHTNLVKLLGFCYEGTRQILIYEYMPFGSLDTYLFSKGRYVLNWKTRYQIMLGVAKGLTYLHQECVDCIIHCDIKPENILLDANFCPKIADFGMAKLFTRDLSRVLTTMRGTIGYLAPEWISGQSITPKADVYSFGLMLFEIISGKRNREKIKVQECTYFPVYAAIKVNQGESLCLLDDYLEGIVNSDELDRACKVACWCIQDWEIQRPNMGQVVRMLEGVVRVDMPPVPRSLLNLVNNENDSSCSTLA